MDWLVMVQCESSNNERTHPQMPVLLMATVTSPGLSEAPDWTCSSEGSASATQRSCSGLVQTPMFGLVIWVSVLVVEEDITSEWARQREGV